MPAKMARLATRPPFWTPEVLVAVRSSRPSCSKAEKREYSWQIGGHPGNPGEYRPVGSKLVEIWRWRIAGLPAAEGAKVVPAR